jgi:hypothetical protein
LGSARTVGVPHGVRKRRGLNALFRPPTGFSRDARVRFRRDAGLSCRWLLARQLKLVVWTRFGRPLPRRGCGPGGRRSHRSMKGGRAGGWGRPRGEGGGGVSLNLRVTVAKRRNPRAIGVGSANFAHWQSPRGFLSRESARGIVPIRATSPADRTTSTEHWHKTTTQATCNGRYQRQCSASMTSAE